ncbi:MAG: hypothetical protein NC355_01260 [Blautia sp.]|nr:hypothetical protein [Blautia sp.]
MKRRTGLLFAAGLLLVALGMDICARRAGNRADALWRTTFCLASPMCGEDARTLFTQEEENSLVVWGELQNQTLTDPDMGRQARATATVLMGPAELAFPTVTALAGEDADGCLLGEQTAWELFGSTGVVGEEICVGNERRTIRAVVKQPAGGVILTGYGEGFTYNRITLESREAAESFQLQSGLKGQLLRLDYFRNPGWLLELIPGKWSDFSGWKENIGQKKEDFAFLFSAEKTAPECLYEEQCFIYWCCRGVEVLCAVLAVWGSSVFRARIT